MPEAHWRPAWRLHFATGTPISAFVVVTVIVEYSLLYFPATFLLEEVSFRGALDAHAHHDGERRGLLSIISMLWGLWPPARPRGHAGTPPDR